MSDFDEQQVEWRSLFRELVAAEPGPTPGLLESRLCAAVRKRRFERRVKIGVAGIAACLLVFGGGWQFSIHSPPEQPSTSYAGFIALPYAQSDVPMEQAVVVRVTLRPNDLETLGLPPALLVGRSQVHAFFLLGQDGMARAVRFEGGAE